MKQRTLVCLSTLTVLLVVGVLSAALPVRGDALIQINPTEQQQTIEAAIGQLFTQTAQAQAQVAITQTIEAGFRQAQTATAAFQQTVQAGFDRALTRTAEAQRPPSVLRIVLRPEASVDGEAELLFAGAAITQRLEEIGVEVITVYVQDGVDLVVELPPTTDPDQVIEAIQQPGLPLPFQVESVETVEVTPTPTATATPTFTATRTPTPTMTPTFFPTATTARINVAEEVFEGGRMMWIQPTDQIWVMAVTAPGRGPWMVYDDTYEAGDPEFDPAITPPDDLYQPTRGFGKLWRENPDVREALGWAVTPEFGYVSPYEYHPGGEVVDGEWVFGPGYHILYSLNGEQFRFNETDGTWELGAG